MTGRLVKAIILLPGTMGLLIPLGLYLAFPAQVTFPPTLIWTTLFGIMLLLAGLTFGIWTMSLFTRVGQGTPAPWDPPQRLVVRGPYRHVRNPMITGMVLILAGQALILQSLPHGLWTFVFFAANAIYMPLVEEPGLKTRFGQDYLVYAAQVPRWLPRITPWRH